MKPRPAAVGRLVVISLAAILALLPGCGGPPGAAPSVPVPASAPAPPEVVGDRLAGALMTTPVELPQGEPSPFRFTEVAKEAGIDFVHFSGTTEAKYFPTANGSGVAFFDFDGDGKLDVYFGTGTLLPLGTARKGPNRLYRNLGNGTFRDATEASGLGFAGFCHGIITGDIDNDGDQDIFLCNYGSNVLYENRGDGTFADISRAAGVDRSGWSSGGAFLDYDNDGDLDLYIANYGEWSYLRDDVFCGNRARNIRVYCSPHSIRTVKHILYRNNGDRTFSDVTDAAGVGRSDGHGFGVVATDLNGDGRVDIYVANDLNPNFLFLNNGDGTFTDATEFSGAAYDEKGQAQSGMGVDAEDVDGDGRADLIVTNFSGEYNTLYLNLQGVGFIDATASFGLAAATLPYISWGTALADFDNDGWPDHFATNGHIDDNRRQLGQPLDFEEPPFLFANLQGRRFRVATRDAGVYFATGHAGRGAAFGDFDDDGDIDIVVNHKDAPPALLRNDTRNDNRWIRLRLRGTRSNRDAIGARVEVIAGGRTITRQRKGGGSMESSSDPRLLIGVGPAATVERIAIHWPSGAVSRRENLETNRTYHVVEPEEP
jgi:hypothetical protein